MRPELLLIEKIELYLEGKLSSHETSLFEKEILGNKGLQEEVELQRQIMGGIQRSVTKKQVALAFIKYKKLALLMKLGAIGSGAAVATIGTVLIINHLNNPSDKNAQPDNDKTPVKTEHVITDSSSTPFSGDTILKTDSLNKVREVNNNTFQNVPQIKQETTEPKKPDQKEVTITDSTSEKSIPANVTKSAASNKNNPAQKSLSEKEKHTLISKFYLDPNVPVTWMGIDFSEMRLLRKEAGSKDDNENEKIYTNLFKEWNELVLLEKKRYDIGAALRHEKITYKNSYANTKNDSIDVKGFFVTEKSALNYLSSNDLQNIVNTYPRESKKGYGVLFIVEFLDNQKKETNTWVTLFDMKTGQVLISEKMRANAGGIGVRNFWARGFHNTINDVKERKYPEWKEKYKK